jgi:hypothetical protein
MLLLQALQGIDDDAQSGEGLLDVEAIEPVLEGLNPVDFR